MYYCWHQGLRPRSTSGTRQVIPFRSERFQQRITSLLSYAAKRDCLTNEPADGCRDRLSLPSVRGASLLLPVPGGEAGPSGVLVCGENWVAYKHQDHPEVRAPLPRRKTMSPGRGLLITSGTLHQQPGLFFHLIQSELGDLYKVKSCYVLLE